MRRGEADWILWGLDLQTGLCPLDRAALDFWPRPLRRKGMSMFHCQRCHRDWYLDHGTGRCCGWWLTSKGWTWRKAPGYLGKGER